MRSLVLDASVILKWHRSLDEPNRAQAHRLRDAFEAGTIRVVAPRLLILELLNVTGRRWGWAEPALRALAQELRASKIAYLEPDADDVAIWVARGLSAYDASYVAVATESGATLITDDERVVRVADGMAVALADADSVLAID